MSEFEEIFEDRELKLHRESLDASRVFTYNIRADDGNQWFCDSYTEKVEGDRTRLVLTNCWSRDVGIVNRFSPSVTIVARGYDITTLPKGEM